MTIFKHVIEFFFSAGLLVNAALFIPQFIRIWKKRTAVGLSLTTFIGFWFIQLSIVAHGIVNADYILAIGYVFSMLTCGSVIVLAIYFRRGNSQIRPKI